MTLNRIDDNWKKFEKRYSYINVIKASFVCIFVKCSLFILNLIYFNYFDAKLYPLSVEHKSEAGVNVLKSFTIEPAE